MQETCIQADIREKLEAYLPIVPEVKYLPDYDPKSTADGKSEWDNIKAFTFDGACMGGQKTKIFAYIGYPQDNGRKAPAIVLLHGGGGHAFAEWVKIWTDRGYVTLSFDLTGCFPTEEGKGLAGRELDPPTYWKHGLSGDFLEDGYTNAPNNSEMHDMDNAVEEQWMFHAVVQTILAHNLLLADPKVDTEKIGITGISWGSVIASLEIGYDTRWAFAIPIYGSGYLEEAMYYIGPLFSTGFSRANWSAQKRFHNVHFPVLWLTGNGDPCFSFTSNSKSYLNTKQSGRTVLVIQDQLNHSHNDGWGVAISYRFADWIVKGGAGLITLKNEPEGRQFSFDIIVPTDTAGVTAQIYYITEELSYSRQDNPMLAVMEQKWKTLPCIVSSHTVKGNVPDTAHSYYVEMQMQTPTGNYTTTSSFVVL